MYTEFHDKIKFTPEDAAMFEEIASISGYSLEGVRIQLEKPSGVYCADVVTVCLVNPGIDTLHENLAIFYYEWMRRFEYYEWTLFVVDNEEAFQSCTLHNNIMKYTCVKDKGVWKYA